MKKLLLSLGLLTSIGVCAQLPSGGQAPDFSTTDIYGNAIDLSDILDSGKPVYMDISATWCGPCWSVHEAHILDDMYYTYGAGGSDEMAVLFFEGDPDTTMEDLYGTGDITLGDWVTGVPYNIINDDTIADLYAITYWPTFYTICPDGTLNHFDQQNGYLTVGMLNEYFSNNCGISFTGISNHAKVLAPDVVYLCDDDNLDLSAEFKNYGNNAITEAEFDLLENDEVVASSTFSGDVVATDLGIVTFEDVAIQQSNNYKIVLRTINGSNPFNDAVELTEASLNFLFANEASSRDIQIAVTTDYYATEISWNLVDSAGNIIFEVDEYAGPDVDGPNANQTFLYDVTLPDSEGCYTVNYYDTYGDGWSYNANAGIVITSNDEVVYSEQPGDFGYQLNRQNAFKADVLAVDELAGLNEFAIYPNPTTGIINIISLEESDISITNVAGKIVAEFKGIEADATLDLSYLPKGIYILRSTSDAKSELRKLIIK